ncbi:MAG: hypothetical protein FJY92_11635, partial [Candidatus Hydrogenedentes bacterium]|nr:hypothetical protein [Candidatus Hydrogenedentota bacterium]
MRSTHARIGFVVSVFIIADASAMDLVWSCEATPVLVDIDRDGKQELVTVNLWGQVMAWNVDGTDKGAGQDGALAELPKDEWSSSPLVVDTPAGARIVLGNGSGFLVCLDTAFKTVWTHPLPGKMQWSRAVPASVAIDGAPCIAIGDQSGTVTCLNTDGSVRWTRSFADSPIRTYIGVATVNGAPVLFAAAGESIHCLDANGAVRWSFRMGGNILAKPEPIAVGPRLHIVCANSNGDIVALDVNGQEQWRRQTGGEVDASITFWPDGGDPLIVCTGLWGDAIALHADGTPAWRHVFRSKGRARPLIADVNGDGTAEMIVASYNQHVYAFDRSGRCVDDVRVSGTVNASPIGVPNDRGGQDVVVVSTTLQAHRFTPGTAKPVYTDNAPARGRVRAALAVSDAVVVENPAGRFVCVNVSADTGQGRHYFSRLSAADTIVLPVPAALREHVSAGPA